MLFIISPFLVFVVEIFSILNSVLNTYIRRLFKSNSPGMEEDTQKKKNGGTKSCLHYRGDTYRPGIPWCQR